MYALFFSLFGVQFLSSAYTYETDSVTYDDKYYPCLLIKYEEILWSSQYGRINLKCKQCC